MSHHYRQQHLPFNDMFQLCKIGVLPHKFLQLNNPNISLLCPTCIFSKQKRTPWRHTSAISHIRKQIHNFPGAKVSIDQFVSKHPGLIPRISGKNTTARIIGGTIYIDHYSNKLFCHLHTSLNTEQTLQSKIEFERHAYQHGINIKSYHADNGRFAELSFKQAVQNANQTITYCAVNAHHQNGIIERGIGIIISWERTLLIHS